MFQNGETLVKHRYAAIMAGGSGERFWPLSRHKIPKQLLKLPGEDRTMLAETMHRVSGLVDKDRTLILTAEHLTEAIQNSHPEVPYENILVEPLKRNTAGCLCWLAANLLVTEPDPEDVTLIILAADHRISPLAEFHRTVQDAIAIAENDGVLVTVGIRPNRPETGYGYIEADLQVPLATEKSTSAFRVKKFHEKPSLDLATQYSVDNRFYWNSGMFFWRLDIFLSELQRVAPSHYDVIDRLVPLLRDGDRLDAERVFAELPDISIDYLLMERATNVAVVEASFDWDDVGSWEAFARYIPSDIRGNATLGDSVLVQTADCVVHNKSENLTVCLSGVYGLLVVATDDAILICNKGDTKSIRDIVERLKDSNSEKL